MAHSEFLVSYFVFVLKLYFTRLTFSLYSSCAPGATKLEVSNHEQFVVLEVDGSNRLVVGMQSKQIEEVLSGELRLAVGGVLIDKDKMMVQVC